VSDEPAAPPSAEAAAAPSAGRGPAWTGLLRAPGRRNIWAGLALAAVVLGGTWFWRAQAGHGADDSPAGAAISAANASTADTTSPTATLGARSVAAPAGAVVARPEDLLAVAASTASPTDARLLRIYGLIATSQATQALSEAASLAAELPNFGLAQLVYADLLTTLTSPPDDFGAVNTPLRAEANERLRELVAEARARVGAAGQRPAPGLVPAQFVRLDPTVRHAVAVDVSRSRLYVFENTPSGLVLKRDYYSSVGKLGMAKQVEGDLRTPLGVYFVTGRIAESRLRAPAIKDLYGAAALALNYPNQYDQLKGRTGSGIWLHGVASALFSRAPLATDGCVALSNPDLLDMASYIERQETPILIAERIEWIDPADALRRQAGFMKAFDGWKAAREKADTEAQARFYAADSRSVVLRQTPDPAQAERRKAVAISSGAAAVVGVSVLTWKDDRDVVVVTFTESTPNLGRPRLKRQYWLEHAGSWQVIYEGSLG
jgi:murein L,D-transpeptidase YafK